MSYHYRECCDCGFSQIATHWDAMSLNCRKCSSGRTVEVPRDPDIQSPPEMKHQRTTITQINDNGGYQIAIDGVVEGRFDDAEYGQAMHAMAIAECKRAAAERDRLYEAMQLAAPIFAKLRDIAEVMNESAERICNTNQGE